MTDVGHPTTPHVEKCIRAWCKGDEDLTQVARIAAWRAAQAHDPARGPLERLLVKAIRRQLIDEWRNQGGRRLHQLEFVELFDEWHPAPARLPTDIWDRVDPTLIRVHVCGESYREVADDLGLPEATVWWRAQQNAADFRKRYPEERPR